MKQAEPTLTAGPIRRVFGYVLLGIGWLWCVGLLISATLVLIFDSANVSMGWPMILISIGFQLIPGLVFLAIGAGCVRSRKQGD